MKPENIILAAAGIIILALLAVILHLKYMYGIRIHRETEKIKAEYNREIERIRSSLSHGFRMPLAIIWGYCDILIKNDSIEKETYRKYLEKICDNAKYLNRMVSRSFMQIQKRIGDPVYMMESVNLAEIVRKTAWDMENLLRQNKIRLQFMFDDSPVLIKGDRIQITNVLNNLFDNAIKYMGCPGCITLTLIQIKNQVMLEFKDNGKGMKAEETFRIFEENFQGSNAGHGSGNGLYIVKEIIEAHNGDIFAVSSTGHGMKIYIFFPTYIDIL
ncbi:MAG: HAMP domain-containing histidine kinase [Lachnospiraceae bacterium]|nr:HAMP domain-containing histidine kinase [Lachnospiraceae bacterium]